MFSTIIQVDHNFPTNLKGIVKPRQSTQLYTALTPQFSHPVTYRLCIHIHTSMVKCSSDDANMVINPAVTVNSQPHTHPLRLHQHGALICVYMYV